MTITLELPSEVEARLRERAASGDAESVRRLLTEAAGPTLDAAAEALLRDALAAGRSDTRTLTDAEFDALLNEMGNMFPDLPSLPEEAVSRASIYEDHP